MIFFKIKRYFSLDFFKFIFVRFLIIRKVKKYYRKHFKNKNCLTASSIEYVTLFSKKKDILESLDKDGFSKKIALDKKVNDFIINNYKNSQFICNKRFKGKTIFNSFDELQSFAVQNSKKIPYFELKNNAFNKLFKEIATSRNVLDIVENYIGGVSKVDIKLNYSPVCDLNNDIRESYSQTVTWHYDVHDINFVYVFFYINGSDKYSGAHEIIKGSHKKKKIF